MTRKVVTKKKVKHGACERKVSEESDGRDELANPARHAFGAVHVRVQEHAEELAPRIVEVGVDFEQLPGAAQERDRVLRDVSEDWGAPLRRECVRNEAKRSEGTRRATRGKALADDDASDG